MVTSTRLHSGASDVLMMITKAVATFGVVGGGGGVRRA
jgi:hypothetical protein